MTIPSLRSLDPTSATFKADVAAVFEGGEMNTIISAINTALGSASALSAGTAFAMAYTVSSTTADADPGAGFLRFDNFAAQTSATALRLALVDAGGSTQTSVIDTFDDSTSTIKGQVAIIKTSDPTKWLRASVTSLGASGYRNVNISAVAGSSAAPFANGDSVLILFTRTGDKGDTGSGSAMTRSAKTSGYTVVPADQGNIIECTSGTFTLAFTAAATLGNGFWCIVKNTGSGDITLDPNGAETIDGLTSYVMYPGEERRVQCDGTAFRTTVLHPFAKTFTASGTFTKPPGYSIFAGLGWGSGGAGAKGSTSASAGGGAGCSRFDLLAAVVGTTETVTIAASSAGATTSAAGANGSSSSFGSLVTFYGGAGGGTSSTSGGGGGGTTGAASGTTGGAPVGSSAGVANGGFGGGGGGTGGGAGAAAYFGGGGGGAGGGGAAQGGAGGASVYGAGGGGATGTSGGAGGASSFGGAGGAGGTTASGGDGTAPGGGGGATATGTKGGDGARGEIRVWGVA